MMCCLPCLLCSFCLFLAFEVNLFQRAPFLVYSCKSIRSFCYVNSLFKATRYSHCLGVRRFVSSVCMWFITTVSLAPPSTAPLLHLSLYGPIVYHWPGNTTHSECRRFIYLRLPLRKLHTQAHHVHQNDCCFHLNY